MSAMPIGFGTRLRWFLAAGVALTLLAACASSPSQAPSWAPTPRRTASPAPSLPSSPSTQPTPAQNGDRWVAAGTLPTELDEAAEFATLAGGGAVLLGHPLETYQGVVALSWDSATGTWTETASLRVTRLDYATAALADGRLFIAGGYDYRASFANSYILDPVAASWTETAPMAQDRTNPAATLRPDGRVLVVGGYHYVDVTGEPMAGSFAGDGKDPRSVDGTLLFDSGPGPLQGRALATAEVFDPSSGTWTATGPMRYARTGPAMTTLSDGRVLVVGSADDHIRIDDGAYRTAELYDPATGRFELVGSLPRPDRPAFGGTAPVDGPPLPGALGSLVALPDGGAVLIGRYDYWSRSGGVVRSFRLSADRSTWREIDQPMADVYGGAPSSAISTTRSVSAGLPDGSVLVVGGAFLGSWSWDDIDAFPDLVRRYSPDSDLWSSLPAIPEGRSGIIGGLLSDGSVLIAGGFVPDSSGQRLGPVWAPETYRFIPG